MDRLYQLSVSGTGTRFLYDGVQAIGEYDGSGALIRRYVPGPALDEPITWYEGSGASDRRWLVADQLGTIVAVTDGSGAASNINTFDEYGQPGASNAGRFQYTGQAWLTEAGLQYSRARAYAPSIGRFLQTDPILQAGGMNLYAYVGNDPVNFTDPSGMGKDAFVDEIIVTGLRWFEDPNYPGNHPQRGAGQMSQSMSQITEPGGGDSGETSDTESEDTITVICDAACRAARLGPAIRGTPRPLAVGTPRFILAQTGPSPPRYSACTEASYQCLSTAHRRPDQTARERRRIGCQTAENVCNSIVEQSPSTPRAEFYVEFPDGTFVYIVNGRAVVVRVGSGR